jgi:DUF971 family protein
VTRPSRPWDPPEREHELASVGPTASSRYQCEICGACGCARCIDEWSGEGTLDPASVPDDVRPLRIEPVGRYAIQIEWSDGHASGIYPFERLRQLADAASS